MARSLFDPSIFSVITSGGAVGIGWQLTFYTAGTAIPITTYNAETSGSANPTTLVSDANGRFSPAWIDEGQSIKWVMTDENGANPVTVDNVPIVTIPTAPNASLTNFLSDPSSNPLPVANGGTGSATAANACVALGAVQKAGDMLTGELIRSGKGNVPYYHDAAMAHPEIFIAPTGGADPRGGLAGQIWLRY